MDIKTMQTEVDNALELIQEKHRRVFSETFQKLFISNRVPEDLNLDYIFKVDITCLEDWKSIPWKRGFYMIFSDYPIEEGCKLTCKELPTIYRGEADSVKRRLQSHLFNEDYNKEYEKRKLSFLAKNPDNKFHEKHFAACMKVIPGINGIDVDQAPWKNYKWSVVILLMPESKANLRESVEKGFDIAFGTPSASREV